jgi:Na+-driven multidrug efflux pump
MQSVAELSRDTLRPRREMIGHILRIGIPSGIMQAILSMSYVFVQSLINGIVVYDASGAASRTIFVAVNTAVTRVDNFATLPNQAFSMAGSTYAGQNIGAGRFDRVRTGFRIILTVSLATSAVILVLIYIFGGDLLKMFIDMKSPDAPADHCIGRPCPAHYGLVLLIMAVTQASSGVMRGAGDTLPVMWITIVATVFMRVPMAYLMVNASKNAAYPGGNPDGIFWSMVICFAVAGFSCLGYYLTGRWKRKALVRVKTRRSVGITRHIAAAAPRDGSRWLFPSPPRLRCSLRIASFDSCIRFRSSRAEPNHPRRGRGRRYKAGAPNRNHDLTE